MRFISRSRGFRTTLAWCLAGTTIALLHPADTPARCGDGVMEEDEGEECDGSDFGGATCMSEYGVSCGSLYCARLGGSTPTCRIDDYWSCGGVCGDGCSRHPEECDRGMGNSDLAVDGCRTDCRNHWCGDGVADSDEQCDDGTGNDDRMPDACREDCTRPRCGDGTRDGSEACDDGPLNGTPGSTCSAVCALAGCGTGTLDPTETCDDGNLDNDDFCLATCVPNVCGDRYVNLEVDPVSLLIAEVCDPTIFEPIGSCRYDCGQRMSRCGNGDVDPGEECDEGLLGNSDLPNGSCRTNCQLARCGDGIPDPSAATPEECDRTADCGADCRRRY